MLRHRRKAQYCPSPSSALFASWRKSISEAKEQRAKESKRRRTFARPKKKLWSAGRDSAGALADGSAKEKKRRKKATRQSETRRSSTEPLLELPAKARVIQNSGFGQPRGPRSTATKQKGRGVHTLTQPKPNQDYPLRTILIKKMRKLRK